MHAQIPQGFRKGRVGFFQHIFLRHVGTLTLTEKQPRLNARDKNDRRCGAKFAAQIMGVLDARIERFGGERRRPAKQQREHKTAGEKKLLLRLGRPLPALRRGR